jgi:hypothetical protein
VSADTPDDAPFQVRPAPDAKPSNDPAVLASVVVRYDGSADRRTLYPPGATEHERLTRWISADDSAFVRLDTVR